MQTVSSLQNGCTTPSPEFTGGSKGRFLNCLETSLKPSICWPSCTASFQLAWVLWQLAFILHSSGQRTVPQGQNTMAVKDGSGPRLAAHSAKGRFLICLYRTSFKPFICWPSCSATFQLACVLWQLAFILHSSGQGRIAPAAGSP